MSVSMSMDSHIPCDNQFVQLCPVQVLKGSHHLGRIDHVRVGDQVGADLERVEQVKKVSVHVLSCAESSHTCI